MNALWDILTYPFGTREPFVRWFAKSPQRNLGGMCSDPKQLETVRRLSETGGYNVYVTLNPTTGRITKRINTNDVTACAFILIDLDPNGPGMRADDAAFLLRGRLAQHVHPWLARAAMLTTGNGAQLWVRLPSLPVTLTQVYHIRPGTASHEVRMEAGAAYWPNCIRNFLEHIGPHAPAGYRIDMTADLARVARMPGSVNQKTKTAGELLTRGSVVNHDFVQFLRGFYRSVPIHDHPQASEFDKDWRDIEHRLTLGAKNYLTFGAIAGDRHASAWKTCKSLHENGCSRDSALEALLFGNGGCAEPLPRLDILRIIDQVYGRVR